MLDASGSVEPPGVIESGVAVESDSTPLQNFNFDRRPQIEAPYHCYMHYICCK